jgi:hypothetical protein
MLSRIRTAALWGLEAFPVECEIDLGPGLPGFVLVGQPDGTGREARERVWPALRNAGFQLPDRRVTANLAPADRRKEGASADLAVGLGVLIAMRQAPDERLEGAAALGELSLDGTLRAVRGTLSLAEAVWQAGASTLLCASAGAPEAALVDGLCVIPVATLGDAVEWLRGAEVERARAAPPDPTREADGDFADVRGQALARRALEIAAAGAHHVLMVGPPGVGKSMLARRAPGILPPLENDEALTVTRLHSAAGLRPPGHGMMHVRPFRAPHHSLSRAGLIGGGSPPRPGELSLAHHGVLFLDELSEYPRTLLDALREPLETGSVWIARERHGSISGAGAGGRGDESVQVRVARASQAWLQVHTDRAAAVLRASQRAGAGSSRPSGRSAGAHFGRAAERLGRRAERRGERARAWRTGAAAGTRLAQLAARGRGAQVGMRAGRGRPATDRRRDGSRRGLGARHPSRAAGGADHRRSRGQCSGECAADCRGAAVSGVRSQEVRREIGGRAARQRTTSRVRESRRPPASSTAK